MKSKTFNRRDFISKSSLGLMGASAGVISYDGSTDNREFRSDQDHVRIRDYRILGRTGFKVSDIGCGPAMMTNENLLKAVIDSGVNIFDTAEFYGNGNNELLVGRAIKDFDRKSLFINTKLMINKDDDAENIKERVRKCLERLNTSYLDGLMLWNPMSVENVKNKEFHNAFKQLKEEGRVKFCGVSCHGSEYPGNVVDNMEKIICGAVEDGRFDHVLFVYNYAQQEMGNNILKACAVKNTGALLMKTDPFGKRYLDVIDKVNALKKENKPVDEFTASWYETILEKQKSGKAYLSEDQLGDSNARREAAINFALSNRAVSSVLISFSNFEEIADYVSLSGGKLTQENRTVIDAMKEKLGHLYCRHACGICEKSCPYHVSVNTIARFNHYFISQKREKYAIQKYLELQGPKTEMCLNCEGFCESACPYGVSVRTLMAIAHENLNLNIG
jgi:aryl-alcohol dehydrogenase-like predicted oxidoreductase